MLQFLQGKKTYIVGICGLLYAIFGFVTGHLDSHSAITLGFLALSSMGIRNGVTTEIQNLAGLLPDKTIATPPSSTPSA